MIDEDRTMQLYGYTSDELSYGSKKPVVVVCEMCGKYQVQRANRAQNTCQLCKGRNPTTDATRKKIGDANRNPSEKTRIRMREAWKTRAPVTEDTKKKQSVARVGAKNHRWKGGITAWRTMLWRSSVYKNWRAAVFKRDDYTCQLCDERGNIQAHHIHPVRDHKNDLLLYDVDNGITLCKKCHELTYGREIEFIEQFKNMIINRSD